MSGFSLDRVPDTTHPLKALLDIAVNDPSGHAAHAAAALPVRGTAPLAVSHEEQFPAYTVGFDLPATASLDEPAERGIGLVQ